MSGIWSPRLANRAAQPLDERGVLPHRAPERLGDDVARDVVVGRVRGRP